MSKVEGFEVKSNCGRVYFVPRAAVRRDYIKCLMDMDKSTWAVASKQVDEQGPDAIDAWFGEQFCMGEVVVYGKVTKGATARDIKRALDFARGDLEDRPNRYKKVGQESAEGGK